jgi:hypothetical protein
MVSKNPRNKIGSEGEASTGSGSASGSEGSNINPNDWKFMTLGSLALRNGKQLVREHDIGFVINARNAELIKDAAQFVLDNPTDAEGKDQRISINASPFYEDSVSDKVLKYFTHRLYISSETVAKMGKTFADYFKKAA